MNKAAGTQHKAKFSAVNCQPQTLGWGSLHCPFGWARPHSRAYCCPQCGQIWARAELSPTAADTQIWAFTTSTCPDCGGSGRLWLTTKELRSFDLDLLRWELDRAAQNPTAYRSLKR